MRDDDPTVTIACTFTGGETDLAIQICDDATGEVHWIPFSQVVKLTRVKKGARYGTIEMSKWIADQKGIEG